MEQPPKYEVIISDRARQQLGIHVRFLAKVNTVAARNLRVKVSKAIRSLSEMPDWFPFVDDELIPANKYHKMYVENWYLVLYQIKDQTVYVDFIVDCRQDYLWLIK